MLTRKFYTTTITSLLLLLGACAPTLPSYKKDNPTLPASFPAEPGQSGNSSTADVSWKNFFQDPLLAKLIETAVHHNQELGILDQEINISNNEIMDRQGEYFPKFSVDAAGGIVKAERFSTEDANSVTKYNNYGAKMSWEIDIWKKLRNATKSAYFHYLSSIEGRKYVITNLVAEVANSYFELMALDNQLKIVSNYIDVMTQVKNMVQLQQNAGKTTSLAVKRFEAEVFRNQGRKLSIEQQINVTQNKLNALLGRYPQAIKRDSEKFPETNFINIQASVPSKLLDNRPDVKQAAFELESAKLNVEVAKARFYPSLSIDGEAGYEKFNSKHFDGSPTSAFYGIAAGLSAPILNRNAIKADYFSANNKQISALLEYEKTLINAYTEVANQLITLNNLDKILKAKTKQVAALNESIEISNILFRAARVDYIESLLTQRDSLEAQVELVDTKRDQLTAAVNLYKSLGGGWKDNDHERESYY